MFNALARLTFRRRRRVLLGGACLLLLALLPALRLFDRLKSGGFEDPSSESSRAFRALHEDLGQDEGTLVVLFSSPRGVPVDDPEFRAAATDVLGRMRKDGGVGSVTTWFEVPAPQLLSKDRTSTFALVGLHGSTDEQQRTTARLRPLAKDPRIEALLGGYPAVFEEITRRVRTDLERAEIVTFPIVAVLVLLIFGSAVAASLPLVVGAATVAGSFAVLSLVAGAAEVSIYAVNIVTMLGLGLGIDYSLFLVSRFREELGSETARDAVERAARVTLRTAGRTVLVSGITVSASLLALVVFPVPFLRSMGLGGALAVAVAVLVALTILPALLSTLGQRVNAFAVGRSVARRKAVARVLPDAGFWYAVSTFVMRRPGAVLALTVALLLALGVPFTRAHFSTPDSRALPAGSEGRTVSERLRERFGRNEIVPIQIVLRLPEPALSEAGLGALARYTGLVERVPGVRRVDGAASVVPVGRDAAALARFYADENRRRLPAADQVARRFARGSFALLNVIYDSDPHSGDAQALVRRIRAAAPPSGASALVGGAPAVLVDFLTTLGAHLPLAGLWIVGVTSVLLYLMLESIVVPLKALLLNVLSLSASFGALVWIFQDGHLSGLLGFTPVGSIDATQPVLIFATAFGLSMDYEVFLLSRVKEHYDATGETDMAVVRGVQRTGSIITSAALLLVIVIAAFARGSVAFIQQIGVGLGVAVFVDATLVRMLLLPAALRLMGRANWWAPAPLARLTRRLRLRESGAPKVE